MKDPRYPFALDLGSKVGGYRIEAILGAGGFGITYRAFNEITQKTVAIKEFYVRDISTRTGQTVVLDTNISEGTYEYALKKFQEEAQVVVSRFSHPYIIKGENFIEENNTSYVIMEYIDGENLEEWMVRQQEPPSEIEVRPMFQKLFLAIDYVHSQNTMHRDITPRNIMLRRNGDPVLIDFGAAGPGIDLGRSSKIVAQLRYAPPEQQDDTGPGIHGRYTDIFSLGGVMYRTVTGRPPTPPATRMAKLSRREGDPHVPARQAVRNPSLYSEDFLNGIDQALRLDERERPASIDNFRHVLGWSGELPASAPDFEDHTVALRRHNGRTVGDEGSNLAGSGLHSVEVERRGGVMPAAERLSLPPQPFVPPKPERQTTGIRFNTSTPKPRTGDTAQTPAPLSVPPAPVVERKNRAKPLVLGAVATIVVLGGIAYAVPLIMAGVTLVRASVGSRADVGATDCDRQALPTDHPDKPPGEAGIDLAQIDAAKAIAACQQALQTYPNVRRFATALGQGYLKRAQYADAQRELRRAIEADDPSAMNILAGLLRDGIGLPADPAAAFNLYTRAANLGSPAATHALGWMYEKGIGRVADPIRAAEFYTKGAALGVAESYTQLGLFTQNGLGRRVDYPRAYHNYERGAGLGSTLAMHQLGYMNEVGLGRPADLGSAFAGYSRAAELGRSDSMVKLGQFYLDGIGRPVDYAKATQLFERAAAIGNSGAMHQLGVILFEGLGREADPAAGIAWLEKAAALGRAESMFNLGFAYQSGTSVQQDYAKAFEWYQKGARLNDAASIYQTGRLYENALGRQTDVAKASELYMRAALLGSALAMYQIGLLYETGKGRQVDLAKAIEWYQRAAELNDASALHRLGWLAQNGLGRTKSETDALVWYEKAIAAGSDMAMWYAAILYNDGRGAASDPDKAASLLLMAFLRRQSNAVDQLSGDLSGFSEDTRKAVQKNLQKRGLYRGAVDGLFNQETRRAVLSLPGGLSN